MQHYIDLYNQHKELVVLAVAWGISELLPFVKFIKANGLTHGVYLKLKAWKDANGA